MIKATYLLLLLILLCSPSSFSQKIFTGRAAHEKLPGTILIRESSTSDIPSYIQFQKGQEMYRDQVFPWLAKLYALGSSSDFILLKHSTDKLGYIHYKYQQTFNGYPVQHAIMHIHTYNDKVTAINGLAFTEMSINGSAIQSEAAALNAALNYVGADTYKWEITEEEKHLKRVENNPDATYLPKGELVYMAKDLTSNQLKLCYKFNVFAHSPISRSWIYIDATDNSVLFQDKIIKHIDAVGSAVTAYSGTRTITADNNNGT